MDCPLQVEELLPQVEEVKYPAVFVISEGEMEREIGNDIGGL